MTLGENRENSRRKMIKTKKLSYNWNCSMRKFTHHPWTFSIMHFAILVFSQRESRWRMCHQYSAPQLISLE
ncbi:hypothetical protein E2C01_054820 [Portunus trituberculatus]|uniref:Uncharacterized protein n=1 Tax=Portunus trituberculatus TaxID=210409 RepID=A0A5B7GW12_PORTR|nr:hypothetical protein [Portunus trituberculatus]